MWKEFGSPQRKYHQFIQSLLDSFQSSNWPKFHIYVIRIYNITCYYILFKIKIPNCRKLINHCTDHDPKVSIPTKYTFNMKTWLHWIVFREWTQLLQSSLIFHKAITNKRFQIEKIVFLVLTPPNFIRYKNNYYLYLPITTIILVQNQVFKFHFFQLRTCLQSVHARGYYWKWQAPMLT